VTVIPCTAEDLTASTISSTRLFRAGDATSLVTNPAESDLVLTVSFSNPFTGENSPTGNQRVVGGSVSDPQFRLTIIDPTTRVTLWTFTEHVQSALLSGNRDKNFDQALDALVNDLKNVAGQPAAKAGSN